jgi:hypothetical protein
MALLGLIAVCVSLAGQPHSPNVYGNGGVALARTWTWDGTDFSAEPGTGSGPYSSESEMAFDRRNGVVVLWDHGCSRLVMGFTGGCQARVDRTWTWNGRAWSAAPPNRSPKAVGQGAMFYDGRLGQVVYLNRLGQGWAWSASAWRPLAIGAAPQLAEPGSVAGPARLLVAAGYDEGRGLLVLALPAVTWTWDGSRWSQVEGGIDLNDGEPDPNAVYDAARGQLVYLGAKSTWTWDGFRWQAHPQPGLAGGTLGYDAARGSALVVIQDTSACGRAGCATRLWSWDGATWSSLPVAHPPMLPLTRSGAHNPPMAFDATRAVMVLFASAT